jgi:hypothetical protein
MPVGQNLRKGIALAVGLLFLGTACATTLKKGEERSSQGEVEVKGVVFLNLDNLIGCSVRDLS